MKRTVTILGLVLTAAITANAQTKAKAKSQKVTARPMLIAQNTTATPTQTTTASATTAAPAAGSKVTGLLLYEAAVAKDDVQNNKGSALVDAVTSIGVGYKVSPKVKVEYRHRFQVRNRADKDLIAGQGDPLNSDNGQGDAALTKLADPTIHLNYSSDVKVFGSNPLSLGTRYYAPVSRSSTDAKSLGTLRANTNLEWTLNPKVSVNWVVQGRVSMTQENAKGGSDSTLRLITGPGATYNFSDKMDAYYTFYTDARSNGWSRGKLEADKGNQLYQEVGMNFTVGPVVINPIYLTSTNLNERSTFGEGQNTEYDLILSASF
jgi:hypothetical protein